MSKRKSQTALDDYIDEGFIREGLVNYLALLGWSTGSEEEILGLDEIAARFSLEHVQKGGAVFDRERLEWLNGQWIRRLAPAELVDRLRPFVQKEADAGRIDRMPADGEIEALVPLVQERLPVLGAIGDLVDFLFADRARGSTRRCSSRSAGIVATTLAGLRAARDGARRGRTRRVRAGPARGAASGPWPNRGAGRPATCSWRSASQ